MITDHIIKKIFIPMQDSEIGTLALKIIYMPDQDKAYFGIGEDEWVIKNGVLIDEASYILNYLKVS